MGTLSSEELREPESGSVRQRRLKRWLMAIAMVLCLMLFALSLLPIPSIARAEITTQDADPIASSVIAFLERKTASLGDQVDIDIRESAASLGPCVSPQPFLPRPGLPQGRVTVGVRCGAHGEQTRYVQATVSAMVEHLVTTRTISPGETIDASMLAWRTSDLSRLRRGYMATLDQAVGQVATRRIPADMTLTDNMIRKPWMVKRGDTVVLTAIGQGFRISRSVEALENGGLGSTIRLKTENNQVLQGKVTGHDRLSVDF